MDKKIKAFKNCKDCPYSKVPKEVRNFYDWSKDINYFENCGEKLDDECWCFSSSFYVDWPVIIDYYGKHKDEFGKYIKK